MDSLLSFPVGLFHPLQHAGYPGALRIADDTPEMFGGERHIYFLVPFMAGKGNQLTNQVFDSATPRVRIAHRTGQEGRSVVVSCHSTYR
jgi:hypothetical protein